MLCLLYIVDAFFYDVTVLFLFIALKTRLIGCTIGNYNNIITTTNGSCVTIIVYLMNDNK